MPPPLKLPSFIHFESWENSLFSQLALWGNKNWPSSIKMKHFEKFQNKTGSTYCIWSSLNAPGTEILIFFKKPEIWEDSETQDCILCLPVLVILLRQRPYPEGSTSSRPVTEVKQCLARLVLGWETTFCIFPFLHPGVMRKGSPQYKGLEDWKFLEIFCLICLHLVQFECPNHWNSHVSSILKVGRIPYSHNWHSGVIRTGPPV